LPGIFRDGDEVIITPQVSFLSMPSFIKIGKEVFPGKSSERKPAQLRHVIMAVGD